jgi:hypothetical protein
MDRPIYNRRVQVDDFTQKKRQGKKMCMAHTVDSKEKILQFRKFAEGGVQSGALSRADIYQRNSSQGLRRKKKGAESSSETTREQAGPTQKARPPKTKDNNRLPGEGQKKGSRKALPQDHKWCKVKWIDKEYWVKRRMDIGVSKVDTTKRRKQMGKKTTPDNQNIGVRVRFTAPVGEKGKG